jgi:hypothetical protein
MWALHHHDFEFKSLAGVGEAKHEQNTFATNQFPYSKSSKDYYKIQNIVQNLPLPRFLR